MKLVERLKISVFLVGVVFCAITNLPACCLDTSKVTLVVRINVPHNLRAIDSCRVYPYPVAPPHRKKSIDPMSIKDNAIRGQLLSAGYESSSYTNKEKFYPAGGWRTQYALKAAVDKSGLGLPHTIFTAYAWLDAMVPYMRAEIKHINVIEKERNDRYELAQTVYDEHRQDLEADAFNNGLFPHDVPLQLWHGTHKSGKVVVERTNWWIVALHKTPGLRYYWLWPVKLSDAPEQLVELNEDNAIHIDGGW